MHISKMCITKHTSQLYIFNVSFLEKILEIKPRVLHFARQVIYHVSYIQAQHLYYILILGIKLKAKNICENLAYQ
jgi:hypothetical protein